MDDTLQREHDDLIQFLYACPVGLIQADLDGGMSMLNPMAMQLLLPLGAAARTMNLFAAFGGCAPELRHMVQQFGDSHGPICQGHRIHVGHLPTSRSDTPQVLACTIVKLGAHRLVATLEDVSERVAQERRLKQAEAWFASLLDEAESFAILGLDASGRIETLNLSAREQTGFTGEEVIGSHFDLLDRPDPASAALSVAEEIKLARRDGWHLAEGWCALSDGGRYRCRRLISVRSEAEADGQRYVTGYTVVLRPVTRDGVDTQDLRRRLTTDHLTGACNRAHFFEIAEVERRRCAHGDKQIGLVTLDVDHFKRVNDAFGHPAGDLVLRAVAEACASVLRPTDTFARLGGEEFVAVLPFANAAAAASLAERMRVAIGALSVDVGGRRLSVTASFGCTSHEAKAVSLNDLIETADRALYQAKRTGRNRVVAGDPEIAGGEQRAVA